MAVWGLFRVMWRGEGFTSGAAVVRCCAGAARRPLLGLDPSTWFGVSQGITDF